MRSVLVPFNARLGSLHDFRKEMDDLVGQFFGNSESAPAAQWTPRLNVAESEAGYEVTLDVPGMKPDEFEIEIRQGDLWITGERKLEQETQGKTWHRVERHYGQFRRAVRLGDDVDADQVQAEYKDGVLRINVPKAESAKTKKIEVKG
jgi:HSP20 family protein